MCHVCLPEIPGAAQDEEHGTPLWDPCCGSVWITADEDDSKHAGLERSPEGTGAAQGEEDGTPLWDPSCGSVWITTDEDDPKHADLECSPEGKEEDEEKLRRQERQEAHWRGMFNVRVREGSRERKHEFELLHEAAEIIAERCLRNHVTLPPDPTDPTRPWMDIQKGGRLPPVTCAMIGCTWHTGDVPATAEELRRSHEHPWDAALRVHVVGAHTNDMCKHLLQLQLRATRLNQNLFDIYSEALAVKERQGFPMYGASLDRRIFEYVQQIYNDRAIRALICSCCARIRVDTGRRNSDIQFVIGSWLLKLPRGSLRKNFSKRDFEERYQKIGSPLSPCQARKPDFADWLLRLHPELLGEARGDDRVEVLAETEGPVVEESLCVDDPMASLCAGGVYTTPAGTNSVAAHADLEDLRQDGLLCCAEDHWCEKGCVPKKLLCSQCQIPLCRECVFSLLANEVCPLALINDNWYGYAERFIYEQKVTWMERTCATPFWTGLMLMEIDVRRDAKGNRKKHKMHDALYSGEGRVVYKGQLFSAPMNWCNMLEQIEASELLLCEDKASKLNKRKRMEEQLHVRSSVRYRHRIGDPGREHYFASENNVFSLTNAHTRTPHFNDDIRECFFIFLRRKFSRTKVRKCIRGNFTPPSL